MNTTNYEESDERDIKILIRFLNGRKMIKEDLWHVINKIPTCYGAWVYMKQNHIIIVSEESTYSPRDKRHHALSTTTSHPKDTLGQRTGAGSHKEEWIAKWFAFRNSIKHQITRPMPNEQQKS